MSAPLLIGTDDGVTLVDIGARQRPEVLAHALGGMRIECVATDGVRAIAGTYEEGAYVSLDGGRTWEPVPRGAIPHERVTSAAIGPSGTDVPRMFVGTEPSHLYRSDDDGDTWFELEALQDIGSRPEWSFPPRPWTHHVRTIAPHPTNPNVLLVGIELGGLMRSTNGGLSFEDHHSGAHRDTHQVEWDPFGRSCVEAGGTGAARSADSEADQWHDASDGLAETYVWSVAVDPTRFDHWYVTAAPGPYDAHVDSRDAHAIIAERYERNGEWRRIDPALEIGEHERLHEMPYALVAPRDPSLELVAGTRDGTLLVRGADGTWQRQSAGLAPVTAMASAES